MLEQGAVKLITTMLAAMAVYGKRLPTVAVYLADT